MGSHLLQALLHGVPVVVTRGVGKWVSRGGLGCLSPLSLSGGGGGAPNGYAPLGRAPFKGAFSHSVRTAPLITLFIPGTPLHTPPPYRSVHDPFKTASGVRGPWDPWQASDFKKKIPGLPAGAVGCRIQDPGSVATGGGKQPTFRTARAQRTVRPAP